MRCAIFLHESTGHEGREQNREEKNFLTGESHGEKRSARPLPVGATPLRARSETDDLPSAGHAERHVAAAPQPTELPTKHTQEKQRGNWTTDYADDTDKSGSIESGAAKGERVRRRTPGSAPRLGCWRRRLAFADFPRPNELLLGRHR